MNFLSSLSFFSEYSFSSSYPHQILKLSSNKIIDVISYSESYLYFRIGFLFIDPVTKTENSFNMVTYITPIHETSISLLQKLYLAVFDDIFFNHDLYLGFNNHSSLKADSEILFQLEF